MKKNLFLAICLMACSVFSSAATSVASLKGTYAFQVGGVSNQYGYYSNNTFVPVNNGNCPKNQNCQNQAVPKLTVGTISFDGKGKATFLSITEYNQGGGNNGGPVKGSVWPYKVSGFTALLGTTTNGATLTLGAFNPAGVATVVQLFTADQNPSTGLAVLEQ